MSRIIFLVYCCMQFYTGGNFTQTAGVNYNIKMGNGIDPTTAYDANGNIKRMQQWGLKLNSSSQIDDLSYQYLPNSNKLQSVTEASLGSTDNKLGDFTDKNITNDDYSYDVNGNLNLDKNKNISAITYNYLNLPESITVTGKGTITYTYDAAGNKLQKQVAETGQPTKTTLYLGGIYENDQLQFIGHEEGRIRFKCRKIIKPLKQGAFNNLLLKIPYRFKNKKSHNNCSFFH